MRALTECSLAGSVKIHLKQHLFETS